LLAVVVDAAQEVAAKAVPVEVVLGVVELVELVALEVGEDVVEGAGKTP
jgi:hypothetical protein